MATTNNSTRQRASRHKRLKNPPVMRLTQRDKVIIKAVNDYRLIKQSQVQQLFFPSKNTAQTRLWLLWQHKFIEREFMPVLGGIQNSPILYRVGKRGADLLQKEFDYTTEYLRYSRKSFSTLFLEHTLGLSELRLYIELSCREHGFQLLTWYDEKKTSGDYDRVQVLGRRTAVVPDGYFIISTPKGELHFFLEYDRSQEPLKFFKRKMQAYAAYFASGLCKQRYGTNRVRVLTITEGGYTRSGRRRLFDVAKLTKQVGVHSWFWFAAMQDLEDHDFFMDAVWRQAHRKEVLRLMR